MDELIHGSSQIIEDCITNKSYFKAVSGETRDQTQTGLCNNNLTINR